MHHIPLQVRILCMDEVLTTHQMLARRGQACTLLAVRLEL